MEALSKVADPEIGRPITELDMVKNVTIDNDNVIAEIYLTIAGCPLKDRITRDVTAALRTIPGVGATEVVLDVMSDEQRQAMVARLRSGQPSSSQAERPVAFWRQDSPTRALLIASGKGGVGKSTLTANLAVALAKLGYKVGLLDTDVYGFSIHRVLGVRGRPTVLDNMILPLEAHGVKVMSAGFLAPDQQPFILRGPMLHKFLAQFLPGVYWGDPDFMLFDLPPGTGDVPISLGQNFLTPLPDGRTADMVIVTTPQEAAARVAVRTGHMKDQLPFNILGVIENMSYFECPSCSDRHRIFGEGGGPSLAAELDTELLGEIPIDIALRQGADEGKPIVESDPDSSARREIMSSAEGIAKHAPSLKGRRLPLMTTPNPAAGHGHQHAH
ncbi:MAG: P-loop NTPase [Actinomycetota bacterium]